MTTPMTKTCTKCARMLPAEQFCIDRNSRDGRRAYCRDCTNAESRARRKAIRTGQVERIVVEEKRCPGCARTLPAEQFSIDRNSRDNLRPYCKACESEKQRIRQQVFRTGDRPHVVPTEKRCSKCQETKPIDEFHRNITCRDGHQGVCKVCANKAARRRYRNTHQETANV